MKNALAVNSILYITSYNNAYIDIYDIQGEKIYTANADKKIKSIDLISMSKGLYFARVQKGVYVKTAKVMLEKNIASYFYIERSHR